MITPGVRDADILPSGGSSMGSGLTLDYRAIQVGNNSQVSSADDLKPTDHYIQICSCGNVLGQCRCPYSNKNKIIVQDGCNACKKQKENKIENTIEKLSKLLLGRAGIVSVSDEFKDGKLSIAIMVDGDVDEVKDMLPQSFHGYELLFYRSGKMFPLEKTVEAAEQDHELKYPAVDLCDHWWVGDYHIKLSGNLWERAILLSWPWVNKVQLSRLKQKSDGSWEEVYKIVSSDEILTMIPINVNNTDDPYNDNTKGRGSFIGNKEEGFPLRRNMSLNISKRAFPDYPQYSDSNMYTQVMERPDANTTPLFDIFNTYYVDDEIEVKDEEENKDEKKIKKKEAFLKTAVTYDSNSVIQDLIKIPQVKSLIDQQASGYVDQIVVTSPSADIQQTQQQLQSKTPGAQFDLQPISGNPYGHVWIGEDPQSHQKKTLDKIVRIDRVTDQWGTLVTILHEIAHHRHPDWSESQVESEAQHNADTVKQFIGAKDASNKKKMVFVKNSLHSLPTVEMEVADTYQKQVIGLQNYHSLAPESGMVFTYNTPQSLSFWMGKVAFPIDIVFTGDNNKILKIYRNCQPNSTEIYSCDNASKVIEVVGSFCAFHNIDVGDHIFAVDDKDVYKQEDFTKYILESVQKLKVEQQADLGMDDWSIKIVMKKEPDSRRFIKVNWEPADYQFKKADIIVNPDPMLIRAAVKEMPLEKLVRHALLHILTGHKKELPEDKEQELITSKLFKDARDKQLYMALEKRGSINKNG